MGLGQVIGTIFHNFGNETSIAGLNNAFHRKSIGKKIYWTSIFLAFLVATIYGLINNLTTFYEKEITTSTDLHAQTAIIFPAISICNHNRVHCTLLFEEEIRQKGILKNGGNNQETLSTIENLFRITGCKEQICEFCDVSDVDSNDFYSSNYNCLKARQIIG